MLPFPKYNAPEMREVPYHEGILVDEKGGLGAAAIESALIINMTHDLTLPMYRRLEYSCGRAAGDVGENTPNLLVDKQSKPVKEKIIRIAESREVKTSENLNRDGGVRWSTERCMRMYYQPKPSYFYDVANNRAEFGSMLRRVYEAGKDASELLNNHNPANKEEK